MYRVPNAKSGVDAIDGAWFERDKGWGSEPIATLVVWSHAGKANETVPNHTKTAQPHSKPSPRLQDVSRLLEAILLEMPT